MNYKHEATKARRLGFGLSVLVVATLAGSVAYAVAGRTGYAVLWLVMTALNVFSAASAFRTGQRWDNMR